jgi:hypothetical protein
MNEWFESDVNGEAYTADGIARQLVEIEDDEAAAEDR